MNETQHLFTGRCHYARVLLVIVLVGGVLLALHFFLTRPLEPVLAQRDISPQAEAGTIAIRPSSTTVGVGQKVTVEVWLEDVADYYTIDLRFSFDPNVVTVPSGKVAPLWDVFDEEKSYGLLNEADNVSGTVEYAVTNLNPAEPFTGTGRVCAVTFSGVTTGATALDFYYVQGGTRRGIGLYPDEINGQIVVDSSATRPVITALDPSSTAAGTPGFTLTVTGRNFIPTSSVHWDGEPRPTTFVSSTQLLAEITAADVSNEGVVDVTVVNPDPDGGVSNAVTFEITAPTTEVYLPLVGKGF